MSWSNEELDDALARYEELCRANGMVTEGRSHRLTEALDGPGVTPLDAPAADGHVRADLFESRDGSIEPVRVVNELGQGHRSTVVRTLR